MTDTPGRLFGPALLTNTAADKYTVGTGKTGIIRQILVVNNDTASRVFTVSIGADAAGTRIFRHSIPAGTTWDWNGFIVLAAAEKIQSYGDATNVLTLSIFGIEVT